MNAARETETPCFRCQQMTEANQERQDQHILSQESHLHTQQSLPTRENVHTLATSHFVSLRPSERQFFERDPGTLPIERFTADLITILITIVVSTAHWILIIGDRILIRDHPIPEMLHRLRVLAVLTGHWILIIGAGILIGNRHIPEMLHRLRVLAVLIENWISIIGGGILIGNHHISEMLYRLQVLFIRNREGKTRMDVERRCLPGTTTRFRMTQMSVVTTANMSVYLVRLRMFVLLEQPQRHQQHHMTCAPSTGNRGAG